MSRKAAAAPGRRRAPVRALVSTFAIAALVVGAGWTALRDRAPAGRSRDAGAAATAQRELAALVGVAAPEEAVGAEARSADAGTDLLDALDTPVPAASDAARAQLAPFTVAGVPVLVTRNVSLASAAGIVVLLHGCTHDARVWLRGPLERRFVAELVARRLFAVALSAESNRAPEATGCWDIGGAVGRNADLRDTVNVALALLARGGAARQQALPLHLVGASSGAYFAQRVAAVVAASSVVGVVGSFPPDTDGALAAGGAGAFVSGGAHLAVVPAALRPAALPRTLLLLAPRDEAGAGYARHVLAQLSGKGVAVSSAAAAALDPATVAAALAEPATATAADADTGPTAVELDGDAPRPRQWHIDGAATVNVVPIVPRPLSPRTLAAALPSALTPRAAGALYWLLRTRSLLTRHAVTPAAGAPDGPASRAAADGRATVVHVATGEGAAAGAPGAAALARGPPAHLAESPRSPAVLDAVDAWMLSLWADEPGADAGAGTVTGVPELDVRFDVRPTTWRGGDADAAVVTVALAPAAPGRGWEGALGSGHSRVSAAAAAVRAGAREVLNDLYAEHEMTALGAAAVVEWMVGAGGASGDGGGGGDRNGGARGQRGGDRGERSTGGARGGARGRPHRRQRG